jgi:NAD-dependent deacetylase
MSNAGKRLVVLTGAGISQESGISTFRDANGLWNNHRIEEVASPQAWHRNPRLVLDFYNQRRKQLGEVSPNRAHLLLAELEQWFDVSIITQNVDDLHERAGSHHVLHLHGELKKARSTVDPRLIYTLEGWELNIGDQCERGSQLRPHIVWFGEEVPLIGQAAEIVRSAELFIVIGTSLQVYPAAGLLQEVMPGAKVFLIDPESNPAVLVPELMVIREKATLGMQLLFDQLTQHDVNKE